MVFACDNTPETNDRFSHSQFKANAQPVAIMRAVHQLLDKPLVFDDPLAITLSGFTSEELTTALDCYRDPLSSILRIAIAVRSKYVEDEWLQARQKGIKQYVILGAGLDSYAYRAGAAGEYIFEVDISSTQTAKRDLLKLHAVESAAYTFYAECDFEVDSLSQRLIAAGFDTAQSTCFSLMGVTPYLSVEAISRCCSLIASCAAGSSLVFDYICDPQELSPQEAMGLAMVSAKLAEMGDLPSTFFTSANLQDLLLDAGIEQSVLVSPDYLNQKYLSNREDGLRVGNVTRIVKCCI